MTFQGSRSPLFSPPFSLEKINDMEALYTMNDPKRKVLFLCTHNSARSQMAEGFLKAMGGNRYEVFSAGTEPFLVHPLAIEVMKEAGVDISQHRSKGLETFLDKDLDLVITVCDQVKERCPLFPGGKKVMHKGFKDPSATEGEEEEKRAAFRKARDEIRDWIRETFVDLR